MTDFSEDDRDIARKGPDAFRTISEVAEELGLPQHVLRFWETKFPQVRPIKRGGGRRYYRPGDVDLLRGVKQLLYGEGYTIRGVQRILREQGGRKLASSAGLRPAQDGGEPDVEETEARVEPTFDERRPGPEAWASGRRPVAAEASPGDDPVRDVPAYGEAVDGASERAELAQPLAAERRPGLTEDQVARLTTARDELAACRRMLSERS